MQKLSLRKMSILGLVLMAASAVTAAVLPNKSATKVEDADNGTLITAQTNDAGKTCKADDQGDTAYSCNITSGTVSTAIGDTNVGQDLTDQTALNTSDSAANPARPTSVVS